jgi:uncharacterized protein (TIGR03067 family)
VQNYTSFEASMTKTERNLCAGAALALAVGGLLVFMQARLNRLRDENAALRQQAAELAALRQSLEKAEADRLAGAWRFTSLAFDGKPTPEAELNKLDVRIKDGQWIVSAGSDIKAQTTFRLDPTQNPKTIDIIPQPGKGELVQGIYSLEGDQLTICDRSVDNGERPTEFGTEPGSGLVLIVMKRVGR